jgi:type I restriction enzyme S subunit
MNWPLTSLGEVLKERNEVPSPESLVSGEVQIVSKIGFHDGTIQVRSDGATKTGMILIRPGDLVVSGINAAKGAIAIYGNEQSDPIAATIHYGAYIPDNEKTDIRYLWWLLRSRTFKDLLLRYVPGGIKTELKAKRLLPIPVPMPSLPVQRQVIKKIELFSKLVQESRLIHEDSRLEDISLIGSELNRIFGDPYRGIINRFPANCHKRLEEAAFDIADGPHITPNYVEDGIPFVTVRNIVTGKIDFSGLQFITSDAHAEYGNRARAEKGDVLISKDGTIGVPCFVDTDREFSYFVSVALVKPKPEILRGRFLVWALRSPYLQARIRERSRGDMIKHLVLREIRALIVPVPPIPDQERTIAWLDRLQMKIDSLASLRAQNVAELDALLPSILDKAFKGDI